MSSHKVKAEKPEKPAKAESHAYDWRTRGNLLRGPAKGKKAKAGC